MKKFLIFLGVIVLALAIFAGLNWSNIQRLQKVNSLFDADKIVHNFSNMDEALFAHPLAVTGEAHIWPESTQPLPDTVSIFDQERHLADMLVELDTTALVVISDGQLVFEDYYLGTDKDDLRISWSMAKSFLSAMFGRAVAEGSITSLEDPVTQYVPELVGSAYDGVPIRHVLNMSSGVKFNEDYFDPKSDINKMGRVLGLGGSMDEFAASLKDIQYPSGTARQYVSIDTHVLGMVLRSATGKSAHDYFIETYGNMGFGRVPYYSTDGHDVAFVLGGLNLRTRDFAKFGQMILQDGMWRGEQVIPANWIAESTRDSAPQPDLDARDVGYGYQWWVPYDSEDKGRDFFAVGVYGQYIYINRDAGIVIAKNAADREFRDTGQSGQSLFLERLDLFRALAAHYARDEEDVAEMTEDSSRSE